MALGAEVEAVPVGGSWIVAGSLDGRLVSVLVIEEEAEDGA